MSNNELLLAISEMMDSKLEPINEKIDRLDTKIDGVEKRLDTKIDGVEARLNARINSVESSLKGEINSIYVIIENEIRPDIKMLAQSYVPAAERFEKACMDIEDMKSDIRIIKHVIAEHSEKLQKLPKRKLM